MTKEYQKPKILKNDSLAEGVYMSSGCYTSSTYIRQDNQTGRTDYRIQINAKHNGNHSNTSQIFTIVFNQDVVYKSSNGVLVGSNCGQTIVIKTFYYQNPKDSIGLGDLVVESEPGLAILAINVSD